MPENPILLQRIRWDKQTKPGIAHFGVLLIFLIIFLFSPVAYSPLLFGLLTLKEERYSYTSSEQIGNMDAESVSYHHNTLDTSLSCSRVANGFAFKTHSYRETINS